MPFAAADCDVARQGRRRPTEYGPDKTESPDDVLSDKTESPDLVHVRPHVRQGGTEAVLSPAAGDWRRGKRRASLTKTIELF